MAVAILGIDNSCCIIMRVDGSMECLVLIDSLTRYVNVCSHHA